MADDEGGRRTRSGRNQPVVSPPTTRRTRKTTLEEEPVTNIEESECHPEEVLEETATIDAKDPAEAEMEVQPVMTVEDDSNSGSQPGDDESSPDDQFILIPDGNGVANNGIEHLENQEEEDGDQVEFKEKSESPIRDQEVEPMEEQQPETESIVEEKTTAVVSTEEQEEKKAKHVAMVSDDVDTVNALKRKSAVDNNNDSGDGEVDIKKQKTEGKPVEPEVVKQEPPKLPDLEKYWKPVNEDSTNFTGWTYLMQYVDQETDVIAARDAYNAFLGHYPYCYGYWRKYADYEKNKGDRSKCEEVFERGLRAIPLSVDLWIHYLNYVKVSHPEDETLIRAQYERALDVCGLEFRSDKLWEAYIKWETEGKRLQRVVGIYDRLLATPTLGYNSHFGSFSDFVKGNALQELLNADALDKMRQEVAASKDEEGGKGEENGEPRKKKSSGSDEEAVEDAIRRKMISARKKIHEKTVQEVTDRWTFEEAVKRPYFHVKPLERCQLKNWTDYLDYEIEKGNRKRIIVLFERCLIACALYEEYWQKFVRFLTETDGKEDAVQMEDAELISTTRDVYERACTIHHKEKPRLHLMWSAFEECQGNIEKAAEILANIDEVTPNLLQIEYRRINVERRRGNWDKCEELFRRYVVAAKSQHVASSLVIKHARFVHKIRNDLDRALEILRTGQKGDPANVRIPLQMIDLAMQRVDVDEEEVLAIMDAVIEKEDLDAEQKVLFAQRKVEFLEDFGKSPKKLQAAQKKLQAALTTMKEQKKAKSLENNVSQMHSSVAAPMAPQHQPQQQQHHNHASNQYANYSYYGTGADASSYGSYSDANYWNQYGQYAGNNNYNNYANYYQ